MPRLIPTSPTPRDYDPSALARFMRTITDSINRIAGSVGAVRTDVDRVRYEMGTREAVSRELVNEVAKRAEFAIQGTHNVLTPASKVDYTGKVIYGDGRQYTLSGTLDLTTAPDTGALHYIFFDPDSWAGEGSGTTSTELQLTETQATAAATTGRRIQVGAARKADAVADPGGRCFFFFSGGTGVVTAEYIYAGTLEALFAQVGTLTVQDVLTIGTGATNAGILKSTGWNGTHTAAGAITVAGTTGWIISGTGAAEFNIVTARDQINISSGKVLINTTGITLAASIASPTYATDPTVLSAGPLILHGGVWDLGGFRDAGVFGINESGGAGVGYLTINGGTAAGGLLRLKGGGVTIQIDSGGLNVDSNLLGVGTTEFNTVTYTWPGANAAGVLTNNGSGTLTWAASGGGGNVSNAGTPVDGQIAVWTGATNIEGDASLTFDTTTDSLVVAASGKFKFGAVTILDDTTGTTTLSNIDALDATTEATIEAAIDTLANLTSASSLSIAGSQIGSGTVADARLSANVAHVNAAETITAVWQYQQNKLALQNLTTAFVTTLNAGDAAGAITLTLPATAGTLALTTDIHAAVTLAGTLDYLTLSGQQITRGPIDLATDITLASLAQYDMLYASGATGLARVSNGTTGQFWKATTGGAPSWGAISVAAANVSAGEFPAGTWSFGSATALTVNGTLTATDSVLFGANSRPTSTDGTLNFGGSSNRWNIIYAMTGTFSTGVTVGGTSVSLAGHTHAASAITAGTFPAGTFAFGATSDVTVNGTLTVTGQSTFGGTSVFRFANVTSGYTTLTAADSGTIALQLPSATGTLLTSADSINAFADVTITSAAEGDALIHNGSVWVNTFPAWHNLYSMYSQDSTASDSPASLLNGSSLGSRTIGANTLKAGTIVHFRAWGFVSTDTENLTLRFFFNATGSGTEAFSLAGPTTDSLSQVAWTLDVWLVVKTAGAGGTLQVSGRYWVNGAEAAVKPAHITSQQESIDTTAANIIELTAQWSATGSSTIYCDHAAIDITRQAL